MILRKTSKRVTRIEELYGITKTLIAKLHNEGIYHIQDIDNVSFQLPKHIIASAKLKDLETRVDRERANLEYSELKIYLQGMGELILAGSYRRGKLDMKDLDFILITDTSSSGEILKALPSDIYLNMLKGEKKLMLWSLRSGKAIRIDLNIVPTVSRAVALVHFTGSAENNIRMRIAARKNGYLLNDKYFLNLESGETLYPKTEKEVFEIAGYQFREPEDR